MSESNEPYEAEGTEYGNPNVGHHTDARFRGIDGRDGAPSWYNSLPNTKFDSKIKSMGTISADYSPISPVRPEGKPDADGLGG